MEQTQTKGLIQAKITIEIAKVWVVDLMAHAHVRKGRLLLLFNEA